MESMLHDETSRGARATWTGGGSLHENIYKGLEIDAESQSCAREKFPLWLRLLVPGIDRRLPSDPW